MRRLRRLLVLTLFLSAAGLSWGANVNGTEGPDRLLGTQSADAIYGRGGDDYLNGRGGNDLLRGDSGRDILLGGLGSDRVAAHGDGAADTIRCGPGRDVVNAELGDAVASDCELVSRQLSRDPYDNFQGQHETQVEPDSFAFGSTIVTTFQSGRYLDGGATNIGFATSIDGGRSWRSGHLPGLSAFASPPGIAERVSDPVVAYDAVHRKWLIASLAAVSHSELLVSRSADGLDWDRPIIAAQDSAEGYDKQWIACDNWPSSRFNGRCYLSYLDFDSGQIRTRKSTDGGITWSPPSSAPETALPEIENGAQPVVRPDGSLIVLYSVFGSIDTDGDYIAAIRSVDGGVTFTPPVRAASLTTEQMLSMRAPPFVSAEVDRAGRIYFAWSDCRFRVACAANDIVLASSRDGVSWSQPRRVPTGDPNSPVDYFVPGLAVDPNRSGKTGRIAVTYHSLRQAEGCDDNCPWGVDLGLVSSADGGATWSRPQRLNAESMPLTWIAQTSVGRMTGDYISTSFVGGRAVPVFSLAAQPLADEFNQAIFATVRLTSP
jgi:hypothetical protein